jgi:hypothetical protein
MPVLMADVPIHERPRERLRSRGPMRSRNGRSSRSCSGTAVAARVQSPVFTSLVSPTRWQARTIRLVPTPPAASA